MYPRIFFERAKNLKTLTSRNLINVNIFNIPSQYKFPLEFSGRNKYYLPDTLMYFFNWANILYKRPGRDQIKIAN